jgi:hypothetical protein
VQRKEKGIPPKKVKSATVSIRKSDKKDDPDAVLKERHRRLRGTDDNTPIVVDEGEADELLARLQAASLMNDTEEDS